MITVWHRPEEDKSQLEDETTAIPVAIVKK